MKILSDSQIMKVIEEKYPGMDAELDVDMEVSRVVAQAQLEEDKKWYKAQLAKVDRDKIARKLWYFRTGAVMSLDDHPSPELLSQADQILALGERE